MKTEVPPFLLHFLNFNVSFPPLLRARPRDSDGSENHQMTPDAGAAACNACVDPFGEDALFPDQEEEEDDGRACTPIGTPHPWREPT